MGSYRGLSLLAACMAMAAPALAQTPREPGERRRGTNPKLIPVDRSDRRRSSSSSLSKLLASGRRRGRV